MKQFFLILPMFFFLMLFSQKTSAQQGCATALGGVPDLTYFDLSTAGTHPDYTLKLYFTIIRDDNKGGGYDPTRIPNIIEIIDGAFNPHGIYFEYVCKNFFINDTDLAENGGLNPNWCNWHNQPRHDDGIDIFILGGYQYGSYVGRASVFPETFIVLNGFTGNPSMQQTIESTTIVHELGHLFGLLHMYHGSTQNPDIWQNGCNTNPNSFGCGGNDLCPWSEGFYNCTTGDNDYDQYECAEDSNNGHSAGDYIPDTKPSHRYVETSVESSCILDPTVPVYNDPLDSPNYPQILDPEGNFYDPDVTNFMSVIPYKECRNHFSPNQVTVMKNHIGFHPNLQHIHSTLGPVQCECDYDETIYIRESENWSNVIAEYNLHASELANKEIFIEQELILDVDYTFKNITFQLGANAEIIVQSGKDVDIIGDNGARSTLKSCSKNQWKGVSVNENASLTIRKSDIFHANKGISAYSQSSLSMNDVEIDGNNEGSMGVFLENEVNLIATDIKIIDHFFGIYSLNNNGYLDVTV